MKKLLLTLIVGLSFIGFGMGTASASTFKDGMILASSCGSSKGAHTHQKCGGDKKAKCGGEKKAVKSAEGKCGGDKKGKCGGDNGKKPVKGSCGSAKCG